MNPPTTDSSFMAALRQQRELHNQALPDTPQLHQWLDYWNDDESFAVNMRNLSHWIACARTQAA
jgi:hypothetical protein